MKRAADRAELLAQSHFRWVAVKIHHGLGLDQANLAELGAGWAQGFHRRGIQVCGWAPSSPNKRPAWPLT